MCFYSKLSKKAVELEKRFKASMSNPELFTGSEIINGFSFPLNPVITNEDPNTIKLFNWGLIPNWARDKEIRKNTLNARVETIQEKASFKNCINNRCLILADGFYEWQWQDELGKKKQKYLIHLPNNEAFAFAGIYSKWVDKETGELVNTYSMVTTEAKGLMLEIHNSKKRMPIILSASNEQNWLNKENMSEFLNPILDIQAQKI
jgi:putative SOS response-associated peptidase YedK